MITPLYLESEGTSPALRVAVLIDGPHGSRSPHGPRVPRWVAAVLDDIARCNFARVELALVHEEGPPKRLQHAIAAKISHTVLGEEDPEELVDPGAALNDVDCISVSHGGGELNVPPHVLREVAERKVDVIVRLCAAVPHGDLLRAARCGVWSFRGCVEGSGEKRERFHKVVEGAVVHAQLEVLADGPATNKTVLCQSTFTQHGSVLCLLQRQVPTWETTHFVVWKLHDLHAYGWEHVLRQAVAEPAPASAVAATAADLAHWALPRLTSKVLRALKPKAPCVHLWHVGLRKADTPLWRETGAREATGFRWLEAPQGHYWADPFLFEWGQKMYLFVEDYDYDRGFAGISQAEVLADGTLGPVSSCLNPGFHLSFPHVFEHDGDVFMLPESLADGTISLYRAKRFPHEWVHEKVLFRGNATDTALWRDGGKFYFFTTLFDRFDSGMKTMLFVADSLTGAWRPHPTNPISSDVRRSRGAGLIFRGDGRLFRPVQNCGPCYGFGFAIEEILTLDPDRYEARPQCSVEPSGLSIPARGVHTYNIAQSFEVIDSYTMGARPR